jgi:hypothetical protein
MIRRWWQDTPIGHSPLDPDTGQIPDDPVEQTFARWTWAGARVAFFWIAAAFGLYVSGVLPPRLSIPQVEGLFHLSAEQFAAQTGSPQRWAWLGHLAAGDALSLAGLVFTLAVMALAYLATLRVLLRQRDWLYAGLVLLQVAIFVFAALSG